MLLFYYYRVWLLLLLEGDSGSASRNREVVALGLPLAERSIHSLERGPSCISHCSPTAPLRARGEERDSFCKPFRARAVFHSYSVEGGSYYLLSHPEVALPDLPRAVGSEQHVGPWPLPVPGALPATQPCPHGDCLPRPQVLLRYISQAPDEKPGTRGWGGTRACKPCCPGSGRSAVSSLGGR